MCIKIAATDKSVTELVSRYMKEIEKLKAKLIESEQMYHQLKKSANTARKNLITFADTDGLCFVLLSLSYLSFYEYLYVAQWGLHIILFPSVLLIFTFR